VIRRIFRDFATGISPRAIAKTLNDEGVTGPEGKLWNDTTIRGHVKRGTGIINNELYISRLVWNRTALSEGSIDGAARLAPQSRVSMDRHGGSRATYSRWRSLAGGENSAERNR
jgi:site-specific DNA recombinase